jgi:hypothetical protein
MRTLIAAPLAVAALVAALSSVAAADPSMPPTAQIASGMRDTNVVGISNAPRPPAKQDESGIDRTFHPDYSHALTPEQMTAAWNNEVNRILETPITGGG